MYHRIAYTYCTRSYCCLLTTWRRTAAVNQLVLLKITVTDLEVQVVPTATETPRLRVGLNPIANRQ